MANINLLPWRENLREERKKNYMFVMLCVLIVAGGSIFGADRFVRNEIKNQQARNAYLVSEIAILDARVEEINSLQQQKREIQDRMNVIQNLQGSRPVIVRVFDELVKTLPEGVYFQTLDRVGDSMNIVGVAESYGQLTTLMRRLGASEWFADPVLQIISATDTDELTSNATNRFTLDLALVTNLDQENETAIQ